MDSNGRRFDSYREEMSPFPDRMSPFLPDFSPFPGDVSLYRREVRPFHAAISQDSCAVSPLGQQMRLLGPSVCLPARPVDQSCVECRLEMCRNDANAAKPSQSIATAELFQTSRCGWGRVFEPPAFVPTHHWELSKTLDPATPPGVPHSFGRATPSQHVRGC